MVEVGSSIKIRIPMISDHGFVGECPWAIVVGMRSPGRLLARIANELVATDLHGYHLDDVVELEQMCFPDDPHPIWQVVGLIEAAP